MKDENNEKAEAGIQEDFAVYRTESNTKKFPLHAHYYHELLYYTVGKGELRLKTAKGELLSIPFKPGRVIIVPPKLLHGSCSDDVFEDISIIDKNFIAGFEQYRDTTSGCIITSDEPDRRLGHLFDIIYNSFYDFGNDYGELIQHLMQAVYDIIRILFSKKSFDLNAIETVKSLLIENSYNPSFTAAEAIERSGLSQNYMRQLYKKEIGMTPLKYLLELRMMNAEKLMRCYCGAMPISEIAMRSGFSDPLYFSKLFRSMHGFPPSKWKKHTAEPDKTENNENEERNDKKL